MDTSEVEVRVARVAIIRSDEHGQQWARSHHATRELREYAERRGWAVAGEYVDIGISGTKETRPELDRLMTDAHRRRFDAVVVWKFDRFARSVSHLLREAGKMDEKKETKRSFWRFGGRLDRLYNWIVGLFFALSCFVQISRPIYQGRLPEALGAALGQTVWVAVLLFAVFKIISRFVRRS